MTIKPTCRRPMASCMGQKKREKGSLVGTCRIACMVWQGMIPYGKETGTFTWKIPVRKVTEEATRTLCWVMFRPSKPGKLADGPPSGTRRVTTAPIIRLRTGKEPTWRWVWKGGKIVKPYHIQSNLLVLTSINSKQASFIYMFMETVYTRKICRNCDSWIYIKRNVK